jgi:hypothetical protein
LDGLCRTTERQEGRDGRCMWHVSEVTHAGFWRGNLKEISTRKI